MDTQSHSLSTRPYSYSLTVVQQPFHARMCGYGEKDRRPVDPPPIVKLTAIDANGAPVDPSELADPRYVIHCSLYLEDGTTECDLMWNPPRNPKILLGTCMATPELFEDVDGATGSFFCFTDLSVRIEGTFRLGFTLIEVQDMSLPPCASFIMPILSSAFKVYSAKQFPGMRKSTELCKQFKKQGLNIAIRKGVRGCDKSSSNSESSSSTQPNYSTTGIDGNIINDTDSVSAALPLESRITNSNICNDTSIVSGGKISEESTVIENACQDHPASYASSMFTKCATRPDVQMISSLTVNPNVASSPSLLNPRFPLAQVDITVHNRSVMSPECSNSNSCRYESATNTSTDGSCNDVGCATTTLTCTDKTLPQMPPPQISKWNSSSLGCGLKVARLEGELYQEQPMSQESHVAALQVAPNSERSRDNTIA